MVYARRVETILTNGCIFKMISLKPHAGKNINPAETTRHVMLDTDLCSETTSRKMNYENAKSCVNHIPGIQQSACRALENSVSIIS